MATENTCYCQIPYEFIVGIVEKKFVHSVPTVQILQECQNDREREYVNTIVLLDVPEDDVKKLFEGQEDFLIHFFDCRAHVRDVLKKKIHQLEKYL